MFGVFQSPKVTKHIRTLRVGAFWTSSETNTTSKMRKPWLTSFLVPMLRIDPAFRITAAEASNTTRGSMCLMMKLVIVCAPQEEDVVDERDRDAFTGDEVPEGDDAGGELPHRQ